MYSIIIPVYKNEKSIKRLLSVLEDIQSKIKDDLEVVFVVDGSPDDSFYILKKSIDNLNFQSQIILHSKNFGSISAVRTGLRLAKGDYFSVLSADIQEPPELIIDFYNALKKNECDIAVEKRINRNDPFLQASFLIYFGFYINIYFLKCRKVA